MYAKAQSTGEGEGGTRKSEAQGKLELHQTVCHGQFAHFFSFLFFVRCYLFPCFPLPLSPGKTTFLSTLLGAVDDSWLRGGSLRVNGVEEPLRRFRPIIGYV